MDKFLKQLRARLLQLQADAKALLDAADANTDGVMTAEDQVKFDAVMADIEGVKGNIANRERMQDMNASLDLGAGRSAGASQPSNRIVVADDAKLKATAGFADMADYSRAVQMACLPGGYVDPRLKTLRANNGAGDVEGAPTGFQRETGSQEGYEVPTEFSAKILELLFDDVDLINEVDSEPTNSNSVGMSADESTPWGGSGIIAKWEKEGGQLDPSTHDPEARQVRLHKLYAFVLASEELLEDTPRLANRIMQKAAEAIRWKANEAIMRGTGVGQLLGILNSGALVTVAKETSQTIGTVNVTNVSKMFSRLISSGIPRSFWMANSDVLPELVGMKIGDQPVWVPPQSGVTQAPGGFLLGRPVRFSEHADTVGTKGDIMLIDPKGYYMAYKQAGVKFASSIHLYFDYDLQAFRWTFRLGGQPHLKAPITPNKGSNTKSHFVALADRTS